LALVSLNSTSCDFARSAKTLLCENMLLPVYHTGSLSSCNHNYNKTSGIRHEG
jgi:hypothetical protein